MKEELEKVKCPDCGEFYIMRKGKKLLPCGKHPDKSYLTAISRKGPSLPLMHVWEKYGPLDGFSVLDYGCGRGADVEWLRSQGVEVHGYDPHYAPEKPLGEFSVALCTYVLNVLDPEVAGMVIAKVMRHVKRGGVAFFTVRRDIKKEGFTSKGTQRWNVELPFKVEKKTNKYCIYDK